jgi:hypothetical protein
MKTNYEASVCAALSVLLLRSKYSHHSVTMYVLPLEESYAKYARRRLLTTLDVTHEIV